MIVLSVMLAVVGGCRGSKQETRQPPVQAANPTADLREPTSVVAVENGTSSTSTRPPAPAITGLKAELLDQETLLEEERVSWSTRWRLCWAPTPGAVGYFVTTSTPEGVSPPGDTTDLCFALTVANGIADRPGKRPARSQQLSLSQMMLSVSVAARLSDGTVGPSSPDIPVGAEYP